MQSSNQNITCPDCGRPMRLQTARRGRNAGHQFYGCTGFPDYCRKIVDVSDIAGRNGQPSSLDNDVSSAKQPSMGADNGLGGQADSSIMCPVCGRTMRLRTARRGSNAGGQFYGCTGYPNYCRHILSLEDAITLQGNVGASGADGESTGSTVVSSNSTPRNIRALPSVVGAQVKYYQAIGAPAGLVSEINYRNLDRESIRSISQWRLDYPYPKNSPSASLNTLISVAESILTRGSVTYCSPNIEERIGGPVDTSFDDSFWLDASYPVSRLYFHNNQYETDEERKFAEILEDWMQDSPYDSWHVTPQMLIASLAPQTHSQSESRVDFLLTNLQADPIIVEIDGVQHGNVSDQERDRLLTQIGADVVRIPNHEIHDKAGPNLDLLKVTLGSVDSMGGSSRYGSPLSVIARRSKWLHQCQLILLEGLRGGWLAESGIWNIITTPPEGLGESADVRAITELAVMELLELVTKLSKVLDILFAPPTDINIVIESEISKIIVSDAIESQVAILPSGWEVNGGGNVSAIPSYYYADAFLPLEIMAPLTDTTAKTVTSVEKDDVVWFLKYLFRKEAFREGQWDVVRRTLTGQDSVVLLPTGAGKSIAFQLASMLLPGRCLVVDPIISLIEDQIDNLGQHGIDRCIGITSLLSDAQKNLAYDVLNTGHYLFCYIAPERLQMREFREKLTSLTVSLPISAVVIDEAHCVSEWGHDFRTAYLNLGRNARSFCRRPSGDSPPLLALTGTASKVVLKDVQRELQINDLEAIITPVSFDRQELKFSILDCDSSGKQDRTIGFLHSLPSRFGRSAGGFFDPDLENTQAGMVFCPHVNGLYGVQDYSHVIGNQLGAEVGIYSGSAPRNFGFRGWDAQKTNTYKKFKKDEISIMVCTKAFGMGIDKPNVRYTVHIGLPPSIESFYQEAGRAGRDRERAECAIILSNDDPRRTERVLAPATTIEEIQRIVDEADYIDNDDVLRSMWFHVRAFSGIEKETERVKSIVELLNPNTSRQANKQVSWTSEERQDAEKAIHQLVVVGVIEDYTIDYSNRVFDVTLSGKSKEEILENICDYVGSYQRGLGREMRSQIQGLLTQNLKEYILSVSNILIRFIYEHIEQSRRASMREMLLACEAAKGDGEVLRERILDYLETSEFDEAISYLVDSEYGGLDRLDQILDEIISPQHAALLRGSIGRAITSYPDVPGLYFLRSIAEELSSNTDEAVVAADIDAGLRFCVEDFSSTPVRLVGNAVGQLLTTNGVTYGQQSRLLNNILQSSYCTNALVQELMKNVPKDLANLPGRWLLNKMIERSDRMIVTGGV